MYLRELTVQDAKNFYLLNANPNVIKHTGDSAFKNVKKATLFLKNYYKYKKYMVRRWAVITKNTNTFIGWSGLKY